VVHIQQQIGPNPNYFYFFFSLRFATTSPYISSRRYPVIRVSWLKTQKERVSRYSTTITVGYMDDLKFRTSTIDIYRPFRIVISVACLSAFCARHLSPVSRKCIYQNVIFRPLKTDLRAHDSPRPRTSVSPVMYATTILFSTICPRAHKIYISHIIMSLFFDHAYTIQ